MGFRITKTEGGGLMKTFLFGLLAIIAVLLFVAIIYAAVGAIFYLGLPVLGVEITYGQAVVLAILISTVG
ncbi:hypothetical protein V7149_00340 [Bacillus sp. JJ1503]|uniref:hypothetical protein n=1 Tax=Bacillus sp. JJ1503 TaxID=3122956 RepID=UPI002FFE3528